MNYGQIHTNMNMYVLFFVYLSILMILWFMIFSVFYFSTTNKHRHDNKLTTTNLPFLFHSLSPSITSPLPSSSSSSPPFPTDRTRQPRCPRSSIGNAYLSFLYCYKLSYNKYTRREGSEGPGGIKKISKKRRRGIQIRKRREQR